MGIIPATNLPTLKPWSWDLTARQTLVLNNNSSLTGWELAPQLHNNKIQNPSFFAASFYRYKYRNGNASRGNVVAYSLQDNQSSNILPMTTPAGKSPSILKVTVMYRSKLKIICPFSKPSMDVGLPTQIVIKSPQFRFFRLLFWVFFFFFRFYKFWNLQ